MEGVFLAKNIKETNTISTVTVSDKSSLTINLDSIEQIELRKILNSIAAYLGCKLSPQAPQRLNGETAKMCLDRDNGMLYREIAEKYYPNQYSQGAYGKQTAIDRVKKRISRAKKWGT